MTIHHATAKRAAELGVTLTDGEEVHAFHKGTERSIEHESAKVALNLVLLAARFGYDYKSIEVGIGEEGEPVILFNDETLFDFDVEFDSDDIFAMAIEAAQDAGYDGDDEAEDDEPAGNVVPTKYKIEYAARGNAAHCGDWLAGWLDGKFSSVEVIQTTNKKGETKTKEVERFNADEFLAFLTANGVELKGKWVDLPNSGQNGWQGRFRMNGRQKLEVVVADAGYIVFDGKKLKADATWLKAMRAKHNIEK